MEMPKLYPCCFLIASLLTFSVFPISHASKLHSLSFQLHLQPPPPLNLHNSTTHPLTPFLLSDHPLFLFDNSSHAQIVVGRACGLYLADPAASMELRYIFLTATLQRNQAGRIASVLEAENEDEAGGTLVMMGSLASGAISIVGGTSDFAFAMGQAKISMAPAGGSDMLIISFDVELRYEQEETEETFYE